MNIRSWLAVLLPRSDARAGRRAATGELRAEGKRAARANFGEGLTAYSLRDYETAIACFNRALAVQHDDADAHNNIGLSHLGLGRADDAMDSFVLAAHFRPQFPHAFYNMALAALQCGDLGQAVTHLEQVLDLDPDFVAAHSTLGYLLTHQAGDFARGAAHIRKALQICPTDADALCNYSAVLTQEGEADGAVRLCRQLLQDHPAMHEARLNLALALLKLGRYAEAWPAYEARKLARGNFVLRTLNVPEWQGESLQGRKLLIYAEQGIGDQIMFASCVPDALCGTACMLECAPQLTKLFARSFPSATVVPQAREDATLCGLAADAGVDCAVAIGSLPLHFRNDTQAFSGKSRYLRAAPARIAYWKKRLEESGPALRVGISWSGGAPSTRGAERSTKLSAWSSILRQPGCHFVNLQYGHAGGELRALLSGQAAVLHDWPEAIDDFDETAALVAALDLVITVQTALVHLSGALGTPTWVMLRQACEWRYGENGESMPWYPGVRLIRQKIAGDWEPVIEGIAHDLAQLAGR